MTTMRNRVAKAIMAHWYPEYDFERPPTQKMRDDFLMCADDVLAELENPTPEMIRALGDGYYEGAGGDITSEENDLRFGFIAAIKAAKQG